MAVCHARGCMVGCIGRISHTNFKNCMVIYRIATSKNHIELQLYWSPVRSETGFVILNKFWSRTRYGLQNFRKRFFLGDDHGELSKGTVYQFIGVASAHARSSWSSSMHACRFMPACRAVHTCDADAADACVGAACVR